MSEEWREVPGWPRYFVSDQGRMLGRRGKVLRPSTNYRNGYQYVGLSKADGTGGTKSFNVHRLVLEAFDRPSRPGEQCRHLNGDPADNRLSNLCWGTPRENAADRVRHGTVTRHHGGRAKLTAQQLAEIRAADMTVRGTQARLARAFGVTSSTISNAYLGRLYKNA
ncbi:HNH endonuclease [Streptomyces sp. NPDC056508]|uniref:HNH endonuclease n=1 Tax=Streptomyces sp. NPDC056508 TaxID=3345845 RepID=UPI0036A3E5DB